MAKKVLDETRWHLDKRVPIALIVTIVVQTSAIIWWAATTNERVNALERLTATAPAESNRLTRVESKMEAVQADVTEIKADIKSLVRREK